MTTSMAQATTSNSSQSNTQSRKRMVDAIIKRVDRTKETKMLHRIVALVAAGMLLDGIDVYMPVPWPAAR